MGSLWPGERERDFGFPVGTAGTKIAWVEYPADDDE